MLNQISGIEIPQASLSGAVAPGLGVPVGFSRVRKTVSMQVAFTDTPTACQVVLRGTIDGINFSATPLATFDITAGDLSGDVKTATALAVVAARADLIALSGGVAPAVTATISAD